MGWRRAWLWLGGIGAAALTAGLGLAHRGSHPAQSASARVVRDMTGREVRIPSQPVRVLSLCTSATDTLLRLGQGERLAAIDEYSKVVPGTDGFPSVGKGAAISREEVIARRIDMAFVWWFQDDVVATLEQMSIPCVKISDVRLAEVDGMIRFVAECMNCPHGARRLVAALSPATRPAGGPARPRVYLEMYGPFKTVGGDCYVNDLLEHAGLSNIVSERNGGLLLAREELIQADPDVVLFVSEFASAKSIAERAGMEGLRAVQAGRVYPLERRWLVAGAGWPDAVAAIRAAAIPEDAPGSGGQTVTEKTNAQ